MDKKSLPFAVLLCSMIPAVEAMSLPPPPPALPAAKRWRSHRCRSPPPPHPSCHDLPQLSLIVAHFHNELASLLRLRVGISTNGSNSSLSADR